MRTVVTIVMLAFVAACGADGEPVRPTMNADEMTLPAGQKTLITISGDARFGVSWSN